MTNLEIDQQSAAEAPPTPSAPPADTAKADPVEAGLTQPEVTLPPVPPAGPASPVSKMRALVEGGIAITAAPSLDQVLRRTVEVGRSLLQPRYTALGIAFAGTSRLERLVTALISTEPETELGPMPRGSTILRALLKMDEPLRLDDLAAHPLFAGIPGGDPPPRSLLAVPLTASGRTVGALCFLEKIGASHFSDEDESLALSLAAQASVAIQNARRFAALQEECKQAAQAQRLAAVEALAGTIGHKLRNPLSVINNAVFFLGTKLPGEDARVRRHLEIIRQEVRRATQVIQDLVDFFQVRVPQPVPVSVGSLMRDAVARRRLPESVRVEEGLPPDLPRIVVDPGQMAQAIGCLVANAVQAMPEGGTLRLEASAGDGSALIRIGDTGVGIPPENLERIFEPLFTTRMHGAGLGLALVRRIVAAHGGSVQIESRVGRGTTVTLSLPLAPAAWLAAAKAQPRPPAE